MCCLTGEIKIYINHVLINECNLQSGQSVKYVNYMDKEITKGKFVCKCPLCIKYVTQHLRYIIVIVSTEVDARQMSLSKATSKTLY